jgi:hypothetical protein
MALGAVYVTSKVGVAFIISLSKRKVDVINRHYKGNPKCPIRSSFCASDHLFYLPYTVKTWNFDNGTFWHSPSTMEKPGAQESMMQAPSWHRTWSTLGREEQS